MPAAYPNSIQTFTPKPGSIKWVMDQDVNDLEEEVTALENVLGVNPLVMTNKDPNQSTPWTTVAGRIDALDNGLTLPVFSSWIGSIDDVAHGYSMTSHLGDYQPYYPQGPGTLFEGNQQGYIDWQTAYAKNSGGDGDGTQFRNRTWYITTATVSEVDANGIFMLPKPPAGYDPLGWYNGSNGFVVGKSGWYHLTADTNWQTSNTWKADTTRRLTIFGNSIPLTSRDAQGLVGAKGEHKRVEYIGIIQAGTTINLGIKAFYTGTDPVLPSALGPRLTGVFLRGV